MKKAWIIFKTDYRHELGSYQFVAACLTKQEAISLLLPTIHKKVSEEYEDAGYDDELTMEVDAIDNLNHFNRTEALSENFVLQEVTLNTLML